MKTNKSYLLFICIPTYLDFFLINKVVKFIVTFSFFVSLFMMNVQDFLNSEQKRGRKKKNIPSKYYETEAQQAGCVQELPSIENTRSSRISSTSAEEEEAGSLLDFVVCDDNVEFESGEEEEREDESVTTRPYSTNHLSKVLENVIKSHVKKCVKNELKHIQVQHRHEKDRDNSEQMVRKRTRRIESSSDEEKEEEESSRSDISGKEGGEKKRRRTNISEHEEGKQKEEQEEQGKLTSFQRKGRRVMDRRSTMKNYVAFLKSLPKEYFEPLENKWIISPPFGRRRASNKAFSGVLDPISLVNIRSDPSDMEHPGEAVAFVAKSHGIYPKGVGSLAKDPEKKLVHGQELMVYVGPKISGSSTALDLHEDWNDFVSQTKKNHPLALLHKHKHFS